MLRECHRVLKPKSRMVGYVIHTPKGLGPIDLAAAASLGPPEVGADGSPSELAREAGFGVTISRDVTGDFLTTCNAMVREWRLREAALRKQEGDEAYEADLQRKLSMLQGITEGLLRRSLVVAVKR